MPSRRPWPVDFDKLAEELCDAGSGDHGDHCDQPETPWRKTDARRRTESNARQHVRPDAAGRGLHRSTRLDGWDCC